MTRSESEGILGAIREEADRCIRCGFCEAACPTFPAQGSSSYFGARGRMILAKEIARTGDDELTSLLRESQEAFDTCLDCYACFVECPVGLNPGKVSGLARSLFESERNGEVSPNSISEFVTRSTIKYSNPLGLSSECREWAKPLDLPRDGEYLLFTGSMYQIMPYGSRLVELAQRFGQSGPGRLASVGTHAPFLIKFSKFLCDQDSRKRTEKILQSMVGLLRLSDVSFYYDEELEFYPGTYLHDLGFRSQFKEYSTGVAKKFKEKGVRKIITVDPHTYDLLKNVYPLYTDFPFEVVFYLDLLNLKLRKSEVKVTFHDPCRLSRHSSYIGRPRELINSAATNVEPPRSRRRTMCCGGPDELLYPGIAEKVSKAGYEELKKTGAEQILTACPVCLMNLGREGEVFDISEFLMSSVQEVVPASSQKAPQAARKH
ncbi:MAG TPA: (Fe-S)-binding protein [Nitrososphaerales archaeon]|nr:(Fe-S)-binding protein [Nitrososphaerales archaeon]